MSCKGCIARQRKWTDYICKKRPDGRLCKKAQERLAKMLAQPEK
jgi:hypothetical protein